MNNKNDERSKATEDGKLSSDNGGFGHVPKSSRSRWFSAPKQVRNVVITSGGLFVLVAIAQIVALTGIVSSMLSTIESGDVAAMLESSTDRSMIVRFASGFSLSIAATLGTIALVGAMRLLTPYRNGSLRLVQYGAAGQMLIVASNIVGLAIGNRSLDATTIGTILTAGYTLPVLVLSSHRMVRAWSVRFTPPPPPLPV
jgi:hypothetical protein